MKSSLATQLSQAYDVTHLPPSVFAGSFTYFIMFAMTEARVFFFPTLSGDIHVVAMFQVTGIFFLSSFVHFVFSIQYPKRTTHPVLFTCRCRNPGISFLNYFKRIKSTYNSLNGIGDALVGGSIGFLIFYPFCLFNFMNHYMQKGNFVMKSPF